MGLRPVGTSGVIFYFSMKFMEANRLVPDRTPRFAASHLGLLCLPMSHKKDARRIWVKHSLFKIIFAYIYTTKHYTSNIGLEQKLRAYLGFSPDRHILFCLFDFLLTVDSEMFARA